MSKVKVSVEHDGTKQEFECDFILVCGANSDYPRLAVKTGVIGEGDVFSVDRAYVALGTAVHEVNLKNIYDADRDEARELVKDLLPRKGEENE